MNDNNNLITIENSQNTKNNGNNTYDISTHKDYMSDSDSLASVSSIKLGSIEDLDELEQLYNELNDYLASTINYPGWIKGIYPIRQTAEDGIKDGTLFIYRISGNIAGSIILNHKPESAYSDASWGIEANYNEIVVIHTFAVHPNYMKLGVGKQLIQFAKTYSLEHNMKAIRLDVSIQNKPAISLYEKCGYHYVDTVDLNIPHIKWFKLYELIL